MRAPSYNQIGVQSPVNFEVDFENPPGFSIIPEVWVSKSPDLSGADSFQFGVNSHVASIALSDNTVYYWKVRYHTGYIHPVTRRVFDYGWTPFSPVWSFRTATNSGQLPPAPVIYPNPVNLPPTQVPPNPSITNPNNVTSASFLGGLESMKASTWVIVAVVVVAALWYFNKKK